MPLGRPDWAPTLPQLEPPRRLQWSRLALIAVVTIAIATGVIVALLLA